MLAIADALTESTATTLGVAFGIAGSTVLVVVWFFTLRSRDAKALDDEFKARDKAAEERRDSMRIWVEDTFVRVELYLAERKHTSDSIDEIKAMVKEIRDTLRRQG